MFDLFKIGFITVTFIDFIDIVIVAFIVYKLYTLLKGTIAAQIFVGLMIVLVLSFVSEALSLRALNWLLKLITDIWVIAFLILFQPEIRRLLVMVAKNPFFNLFVKQETPETASIITDAAFELSQHQHGALMIIIRSTGIRGYAETGEIINARVSKALLTSIFFPRSPLHDGAVVIKNNIIEAARATLPLSSTTQVDGESLGMRHRAGLGISEQADVIAVIVSEETGAISIAEEGKLIKGLSKDNLRQTLLKAIKPQPQRGWRTIIEQYIREK